MKRVSWMIVVVALFIGICAVLPAVAERKVIDNWNTAACQLTDGAVMHLQAPTHVERVELWRNWEGDRREVPYKLFHEGRPPREGVMRRGSCDPYQKSWCVAEVHLRDHFQPGRYMFKVPSGRLCQNSGSGGQGFIKVFARD